MKKQLTISGVILIFATGAAFGANEMSSDRSLRYDQNPSDLYRANELSVEAFGTDAIDEHTVNHLSGNRVRHDSRLGAGLGVNYFFTKYLGVGGEGYTENTSHYFVDVVSGSLIGRLPIANTGLAPYVFGGGGHRFDPTIATFGHAGGGLEWRITPHLGVFADARWVWTDRVGNYGLGRAGVRFAF